jgi:uncharacterized damage-inducible protein DinB
MSATLTQLLADYIDGSRLLREAVRGLDREQLLARPVAGQWSTLEVVCHIADFEPILAERMKRILAEEQPQLRGADEKRFAAALAYHERNLEEELALVEYTRAQMARILRTLPLEALQRSGIHSERGSMTLEQVLAGAIRHIPHHIQFIHRKRQALGLSA